MKIKILSHNDKILTFEAHLLTADIILDGSKRLYPKQLVDHELNKKMSQINNREVLGEIFTPKDRSPSRQLTILYKQTSHIITGVKWINNNQLIGTLETLNSTNGNLLRNMILGDIPTLFKLRGYGDTKKAYQYFQMSGTKEYNLITSLSIVTWDVHNELLK